MQCLFRQKLQNFSKLNENVPQPSVESGVASGVSWHSSAKKVGDTMAITLIAQIEERDGFKPGNSWEVTAEGYLRIGKNLTLYRLNNNPGQFKHASMLNIFNVPISEIKPSVDRSDTVEFSIIVHVKNVTGYTRFPTLDFRTPLRGCDAKIITKDGKSIDIHKSIISLNSAYFASLTGGSFALPDSQEFKIEHSFDEFHELLNYWYDKSYEVNDKNLEKIIPLSMFYQDNNLSHECYEYIKSGKSQLPMHKLLLIASMLICPWYQKVIDTFAENKDKFDEAVKIIKAKYKNGELDIHEELLFRIYAV